MGKTFPNLFEEAHRLPEKDRATLAASLIDSLDPHSDPDASKAWEAEVLRRLKEVQAGQVKMVPWSEVRRMILSTI